MGKNLYKDPKKNTTVQWLVIEFFFFAETFGLLPETCSTVYITDYKQIFMKWSQKDKQLSREGSNCTATALVGCLMLSLLHW